MMPAPLLPGRRRIGSGLLFALCLALPTHGFAFVDGYCPLNQKETARRMPVQHLGTLGWDGPETLAVGPAPVAVEMSNEGRVELSGQDRHQRPFRVRLYEPPYEAYAADLDHNGITDLLLVTHTMGNGLAPTTQLLTYLFDEEGRPAPFTSEGYLDLDPQGLSDLVDLDGDGRAELIYMTYNDGYWITTLYGARDARWQRIEGEFAGRRYPLHTRFTNQPNRKLVTPGAERHPFAGDLSNAVPVAQGGLAFQWADVRISEDISLEIKPTDGKRLVCQPSSWHASFSAMIDRPEGREIASLSNPDATHALLDEIQAKGYGVQLFGQRSKDICSPELLWATPPSAPGVKAP